MFLSGEISLLNTIMKEYQTTKGQSYIVSSKNECQVKGYLENNSEYLLLTVPANSQAVFVAISSKTKLTDTNSVIIPFDKASIALGAAGGGISEEELINFGLLEEWTTEDEKLIRQLGANTGFGSQKPTFKQINGVTFTYSLTSGVPIEFNRVEICVKTEEIPILIVGGTPLNYLSHRIVDDYFYITYNTNTKLTLKDIDIRVIGALSVGGGEVNNPLMQGYTLSDNVDYYPYAKLFHVSKTEHVGIETQVYDVVKKEKETNKILPFSDENTTRTNSLLDSLIQDELNVDIVLHTGKLSSSGDEVITSVTIYVRNGAMSEDDLSLSFKDVIERDGRGTAVASLCRIR